MNDNNLNNPNNTAPSGPNNMSESNNIFNTNNASSFIPNNVQNPTPVTQNNAIPNNINSPYNNSLNQNNTNTIASNQTNNFQANDDELLKSFIGNNYYKITAKSFNFAGFFFTTFYMLYRKMFLYSIILFIINLIIVNIINNFIVNILFGIVVGLFVNKIYLYYAKQKITKIKIENPQKNIEDLKAICAIKGGTSIGQLFLGFLTQLVITFIALIIMAIAGISNAFIESLNFNNWNSITDNNSSNNNETLVEDVDFGNYYCIGDECNIDISKSNNLVSYKLDVDNSDFFITLQDYTEYIRVDIYYTQSGSERTIVNYKIYLRSNNEDISDANTEDELRAKIGLYLPGTHTASFTLTKIGSTGFGYADGTSYSYTDYTFIDSDNNEYEMRYINTNGMLNLIEGNTYNVTFEVVNGSFGYEFNIQEIR